MRQIRRWKNDSSVCWDDKGGRMKQIRTERTGMERIRMDRVNAILKHKTYRKYYDQIEKLKRTGFSAAIRCLICWMWREDRLYLRIGAESGGMTGK